VTVNEVRWVEGGSKPADDHTIFYGNWNANHHLRAGFVVHKGTHTSSDRMSYITLRGHWCDIVLIVYAPTEDKSNYMKNSFYEELEQVLDQFLKYHVNILLGDFNARVGREDIFKPTIGNESLHEISNDNGVKE
jgi:exonuclease III